MTILYIVPPLVLLLGQSPVTTPDHFSALKIMMSGAGPISVADGERVMSRTRNNFIFLQGVKLII